VGHLPWRTDPTGTVKKTSTNRHPNDACRIPLRSGRRAAWLSTLVPGVGDLYLRQFFTGVHAI
jgi:hypothetical protein